MAAYSKVNTDTTVAEQLGEPLGSDLSSLLLPPPPPPTLIGTETAASLTATAAFQAKEATTFWPRVESQSANFQTVGHIWQMEGRETIS